MIWAPKQKFAEEVIEECASFPYGDHDDLVDSTTQAIMRFRQGGLIELLIQKIMWMRSKNRNNECIINGKKAHDHNTPITRT